MKHSVGLLLSLALAGCSSNLLGGGSSSGPVAEQSIPVGNQLALPPDLSLRAPGATTPAYRSNAALGAEESGVYSDDINTPVARKPVAAKPASVDVYEKYGVSTVNADGTKKKDAVLKEELRLAVLAEKRKTNPNYGTVRNIGELFRD